MKISTNYKLKLPESSDPVQVADLSGNFSELDKVVGGLAAKVGGKISVVAGTVTTSGNGDITGNATISLGKVIKALFLSGNVTVSNSNGSASVSDGIPAFFAASFTGSSTSGNLAVSNNVLKATMICPAINNGTSATVSVSCSKVSGSSVISAFKLAAATVKYVAIVEE